jgi:hypothetical protein
MVRSRSSPVALTKKIRLLPDFGPDGQSEPHPVNTRATYRTTKAIKVPRRPRQTPRSKLRFCIISAASLHQQLFGHRILPSRYSSEKAKQGPERADGTRMITFLLPS